MALLAGRQGLKRLVNGLVAPATLDSLPALSSSLRGFAAQPAEGKLLFAFCSCILSNMLKTLFIYNISNVQVGGESFTTSYVIFRVVASHLSRPHPQPLPSHAHSLLLFCRCSKHIWFSRRNRKEGHHPSWRSFIFRHAGYHSLGSSSPRHHAPLHD